MRKLLVAIALTTSAFANDVDVARLSEAFGHLIGRNLETPGFQLDMEAIIAGMRAAAEGKPSPMTDAEYEEALGNIQREEFEKQAEVNLAKAESFLVENRTHEGTIALEENKLQYRVEQAGKGAVVQEHTTPTVHYTGRYMDGTVFGTSQKGDPINLPLDQAIPGFAKGVVGMKEGEKRTIFVHPDLGYGKSGQLLPNSLLVFEVEVVSAGDLTQSRDPSKHR